MRFRSLPRNSVIVKFISIMLLILVVPFSILIVVTSDKIADTENQSASQYLTSNLRTVSTTVDQILKDLERSHTTMFGNPRFVNAVKRLALYDDREAYSDFKYTNEIKDGITDTALSNNYIYSVYTYCFKANRMFSSKINWDSDFNHFDTGNSSWYQTYTERQKQQPWSITTGVKDDRQILSCFREVREYGNSDPYALLSVNVDSSVISNLLKEINIDRYGYAFMMDDNETIIADDPESRQSVIYNQIIPYIEEEKTEGFFSLDIDGQKMFVSYYTSSYSHFKYVVAASQNHIETVAPILSNLLVVFFICCAVIAILSLLLAYHYFFVPIRILFRGMKKVQNGDFNARLPQNRSYEIGYINENFNNMVKDIQKLIEKNYINTLVNKEAQLKTIQNQLNEHFLYNTLDSIHWLARMENAPLVCEMVFSLASFYRLSLSSGKDIVPVKDVCEMIRNYLYIQKIRMEDALTYELIYDDSVLEISVLKYLFQPIVENAVIHGIKNLQRPGKILISFFRTPNSVRFCVEDNGNGIEKERLAQIWEQLKDDNSYCEGGFALKTIHSQLKIVYGADTSLHIETTRGCGTKVWFDLPLDKTEGNHLATNDHRR